MFVFREKKRKREREQERERASERASERAREVGRRTIEFIIYFFLSFVVVVVVVVVVVCFSCIMAVIGGKWKERARDPNVVAKDLLTKMISLLIGTLVFSVELR